MHAVLVTYIAPEGDALSVTMGGLDFASGSPVEIDPASFPAHVLAKLRTNQHFIVADMADVADEKPDDFEATEAPKRRGRPPRQADE